MERFLYDNGLRHERVKSYLKCIKLHCIELELYTTFKDEQYV